jgi:hypothetical protein
VAQTGWPVPLSDKIERIPVWYFPRAPKVTGAKIKLGTHHVPILYEHRQAH